MKRIAIFASGSGSNAENISLYFKEREDVAIVRIYSNKPDAFVLERARKLGIPTMIFNREDFTNSSRVVDQLKGDQTDLVVLAGFLWLVPSNLLKAYEGRIINIHPALLPKYGGRGMYGSRVHEAVKESGDPITGITIHQVNDRYDEGKPIFQATCIVEDSDTPDTIASKVHALEYEHFPRVIDDLLKSL